ncbi:hypothetical protein H9P43_005832 [Blastocladiella emersonii ATCC 22665]|nr:hypothetical protein H9P43_005832 [Blastocladiella emersonii ATCC 22665]
MSIYQRGYLVVYNAISFLGWGSILARAALALVNGASPADLYSVVGDDLRYVQTLAVFEIVHAVLGIVKSPIITTATQIASRLLIVWVTLHGVTDAAVQQHWTFLTLIVAWCSTEIVRYSFYGLSQVNVKPYFLVWLRYTSFIPLYPLGVFSECSLIVASLPAAHAYSPALYYALIAILFTYPPGLYMLYTYMIKQRKKVLGGGSSTAAKKVKSQ